ncbi:type I methionyl aminopeptidase [Parasphaerochaeta coccoides]|uniref:Methionine aminopeptidase n=1 Tax=Parasphaerochaeta coccoides (strain ATCC BAA-1237 / DSM 17374 / SPN1) TaxID=760011 RepID=F4GJ67_PARC1|nr:type I methionyl aminopeptidase [Parasphaerochaeta coccoides]AEC01707.1 methionine aminopeptidase, type I [Parasphaerochaeta coccoides DSM 17374]
MIQLKNEQQIEGIRRSCRLLARLLDSLETWIQAGMSTKDIDKYCHDFMVKNHGKPTLLGYMGFPAATCISVNEEVIHGIPNKHKVVRDGDLVSVDTCIDLEGYISDSSRTYIIGGKTDSESARLVKVTRECLDLAVKAAGRPGARLHDIGRAVFNHADRNGFGVVRDYCGHGVGLAVHEPPEVPNYVNPLAPNPRLRPGMVIAVEPMITMGSKAIRELKDGWTVVTADGKPAAHFEHTIAITANGAEILTVDK